MLTNKDFLIKFAQTRMPYGKYQGMLLIDLPEPYVVWYHQKGFPQGELGRMLGLLYEIKVNGLEHLFEGDGADSAFNQELSANTDKKPQSDDSPKSGIQMDLLRDKWREKK